MDKNISASNIKFNDNGDKIVAERDDGAGKTQTLEFGYIRLINEKQERRISYKTLIEINKIQNTNFSGRINIPELNMNLYASQIAMTRSDTEEVREIKNFTNLPTETLNLDENFNLLTGIIPKIERDHDKYYLATCHYVVKNGEKQYFMEPHQIKELLTMVRDEDPDYPHRVQKALHYGRDIWETRREQS